MHLKNVLFSQNGNFGGSKLKKFTFPFLRTRLNLMLANANYSVVSCLNYIKLTVKTFFPNKYH